MPLLVQTDQEITTMAGPSLGEQVLGQDLIVLGILRNLTNLSDLATVQGLVSLYACKVLSEEALRLHLARQEAREYGMHFGEFEYIGKRAIELSVLQYEGSESILHGDDDIDGMEEFSVIISEYLNPKGPVKDLRKRIKRMHYVKGLEYPKHRKSLNKLKTRQEVLKEYKFLTYVPFSVYQKVRQGLESKMLLQSDGAAEHLDASGDLFQCFDCAIKSGLHVDLIRPLMPHVCINKFLLNLALFNAASAGHLGMVKYLIETDRVRVDEALTDSGTTCLMAASTNFLEIVRYLIEEAGADVHKRSDGNKSIFTIAAEYGRLDIMEYLSSNQHVDVKKEVEAGILIQVILRATVLRADTTRAVMELLIETAGCDPNIRDAFGYTALHVAIKCELVHVVKYLCTSGKVNVDVHRQCDEEILTPLEMLCNYHDNVEIAKMLVQHGADATARRLITPPAELDLDPYETGPFIEAVREGHMNLIRYFVELLENRSNLGWSYKYDLLMHGARTCQMEVVEYAFDEVQVDINCKDHTSKEDTPTVLHCALIAQDGEMVEYLIGKNADVNLRFAGWTPLMLSARVGDDFIVKYLLNTGKVDMNAVNEAGNTALMISIIEGVRGFGMHGKVVKLLLDRGAAPNIVNSSGETALSIAVYLGDLRSVQTLISDQRVNLLGPNEDGSVLKLASENGDVRIVDELLSTGAFHSIFSSDEIDAIRKESRSSMRPSSGIGMSSIFEQFGQLAMNHMFEGSGEEDESYSDESDYYDSDDEYAGIEYHDHEDGSYYIMDGMHYDASTGRAILPFPIPANLDANYRALLEEFFVQRGIPRENDTRDAVESSDTSRNGVPTTTTPSGTTSDPPRGLGRGNLPRGNQGRRARR